MTRTQIVSAIKTGQLVKCEAKEWPDVRTHLHAFAARSIDDGQHVYAQIALSEVKRLDKEFREEEPETPGSILAKMIIKILKNEDVTDLREKLQKETCNALSSPGSRVQCGDYEAVNGNKAKKIK